MISAYEAEVLTTRVPILRPANAPANGATAETISTPIGTKTGNIPAAPAPDASK